MNQLIFKSLAEEWLLYQKNFIKESTYCTYKAHMENHIIPLIGNIKCCEMTSNIVQDSILKWLGGNKLNENQILSEKTVHDIVVILKTCLKYGIRKGYIIQDSINIVLPNTKGSKSKIQVFDANEQKVITQAILTDLNNRSVGILLGLHTGMRIGELCALKWSDIDLTHGFISVSKTLQRLYFKNSQGKGYTKITITTPKTRNSVREIPISTKLAWAMEKLFPNDLDTYVLTNAEKYTEPRTYRDFYFRFINDLGIQKLKFHCLRHTFATKCIEGGADYKTVSELLGHANVNITMNLYVHPSMEQKRKCVELFNSMF